MKEFHDELNIVQDIIKRMADNSFKIKGWAVTLVSAIIFLSDGNIYQYSIAILPVVCFWYLDAYFLNQERSYRNLYNWLVENRPNTNDFRYDLNINRLDENNKNIIGVMSSRTLVVFYGTIFLIASILLILKMYYGTE